MPRQQEGPNDVESVAGLHMLLADSGSRPIHRLVPPAGLAWRYVAGLARTPKTVVHRAGTHLAELGNIARGRSYLAPASGDKRFADPAWSHNTFLRGLVQSYLASSVLAEQLIDDAGLGWPDDERLRFIVSNLTEAAAPSNNPLLNPLMWTALVETRGRSAIRGIRQLASDLKRAPRMPTTVDTSQFTVGKNLAATDGAVVFRTPVFELIQYRPTTSTVSTVPLLMVPPLVNKFYIADLSPGRSLVEALVNNGQQVFIMSWRNPMAEHSGWGLDTYGQAVIEAMTATQRIAGVDKLSVMAFCSGGIITSMALAHFYAKGQGSRIASANFAVTVLDNQRPDTTRALIDESSARDAINASRRKGYLDGAQLLELFAWLRPNELIWNYWINNYLRGKKPTAFDILAWNVDTTRMPAVLHRDFLGLALSNGLSRPGATTMLGTPVDLSVITADSYVIAGMADHLSRWQACYRTTQLLGGDCRFVLSRGGHIAAIINPPGNVKAHWHTATVNPDDGEQWLARAQTQPGSWWPDFMDWLAARSGAQRSAPSRLGGRGGVVAPAPGEYVHDR